MRTRSQSRNLNCQQIAPPAFVEPFNLEEPIENPAPPVVTMDDNRTMAQLLEAPTEGYEDAIVVPEITVDNFELKHDHFYDEVPERPEYVGGNFLDKMPRDCLRIIESKSKVRNSRNKPVVAKVSTSTSTPGISSDVAELKDMVKALLLDKKSQAPTPVKAIEALSRVVQPPAYQAPAYQAPAPQIQGVSKEDFQAYVKANDAVNEEHANQGITTRSGIAYKGPTIPITSSPKVMERETEVTKDTMPPTNNGSTKDVQPPVVPVVHHESISEPVNAPVSASMPNQKASIPFPSRRNDERRREKANDQIEKFYEIF
ncbi:hypothetical protein Tco_0517423 [Tanacetum coccineum]